MPPAPPTPRRRRAPRSLPLALTLAVLATFAGCRGPDVRPDLAEAGFRTPEQTFLTWRAAFLSDLYPLEFQCLSAGFRRENGISLLAYAEAREMLLQSQPFLRFGLSRSEIQEVTYPSPDRARLVIRSESLFHDVRFEVELAREGVYEVWIGSERAQDDYLNALSDAFEVRDHADRKYAQAWVVLESPELLEDPERLAAISELRVALEWKIHAIRELESGSDGPAPRETPP